MYFVIGMRDVDEKVRMQMKQDKEMEMQREIITALGYDYFSVLLVDLEKDHVTIFRQRSLNGKSIADLCAKYHNCWSEFIPNYAKERVSDASYDEFMENCHWIISGLQKNHIFRFMNMFQMMELFIIRSKWRLYKNRMVIELQ